MAVIAVLVMNIMVVTVVWSSLSSWSSGQTGKPGQTGRQDRQIRHLNLTFQVTFVGQLSQFSDVFTLHLQVSKQCMLYLNVDIFAILFTPRSFQVPNQGPDFSYCIPGKYLVCSSKSLWVHCPSWVVNTLLVFFFLSRTLGGVPSQEGEGTLWNMSSYFSPLKRTP